MTEQKIAVTQMKTALNTTWEVDGDASVMGAAAGEAARVFIDPEILAGVDMKSANFFSLDVYSLEKDWTLVFMYELWEKGNDTDEPDLTIRFSMIPEQNVCLTLPFSALDAQNIFLPRTPGKLRSFVTGRAVLPENIGRMAIGLREGWADQKIRVSNMRFTDEESPYPYKSEVLVDAMGQKNSIDWPGKTHSIEEMSKAMIDDLARLRATEQPANRSRFGGCKEMYFGGTGYFRLEKTDTHWWLVDPDGYAFLTAGMDCVRVDSSTPIEGLECCYEWLPEHDGEFKDAWLRHAWVRKDIEFLSFALVNLIRTFGKDWRPSWTDLTTRRLKSWGFNTIGAFSDMEYVKDSGMPYTGTLQGYPETEKFIYRDFPDVFSEEFHKSSAEYASQLEELLDDVNMVGYYMRNEPQWAFSHDVVLAEELVSLNFKTGTAAKFTEFLKERYADVAAFNVAWNLNMTDISDLEGAGIPHACRLSEQADADLRAFTRIMITEYVKVPALALKAVDPNHLNLGMRYAFILYPDQAAGCEYMDVFSINCYKIDPTEVLERVASIVKMPVMIGEYHFGALDRGLEATGIIGVASQEDRGKAYRYYFNHAIHIPECVGIQYFEFNDQAVLGRPDGENYQIGFLDICGKPYKEMCEAAILTHEEMYAVADGKLPYVTDKPVKIVSNIAS